MITLTCENEKRTMSKDKPNRDMYEEALEILAQSETLKQTVIWQDTQVEKLVKKYTEAELDALSWEEKEKHIKETEELYGRLMQSVNELKALDMRYQALKVKLKARFGKDFMPPLNGNITPKVGPDDEIELQ